MTARRRTLLLLGLLVVLAAGMVVVDIPGGPNLRVGPIRRSFDLRLGLDLSGGSRLLYSADTTKVPGSQRSDALAGVRDVIERRVNAFGVSEPVVQTVRAGDQWRVSVELAGIKDVNAAIRLIGETPLLEFKELPENADENSQFIDTGLSGKQLSRSEVQFDPQSGEPQVSLQFNAEGAKLFAEITKRNLKRVVAIFLDGAPISLPTVQSEITDGRAVITGNFTLPEAKLLARRLNSGALPVPIELISQETVGPTLGRTSVAESAFAGALGLVLVAIFMIAFYRLLGSIAVLALLLYAGIVLAIFKLWPVTLTLAGIAGFILSIGMAVDANILIFERTKEELRRGRSVSDAVEEGFRRAWLSIRDSNISSLITAAILTWFGSSLVKGFAITLAIGVLVSMFSAITVTRTLLRVVVGTWADRHTGWFGVRRDDHPAEGSRT